MTARLKVYGLTGMGRTGWHAEVRDRRTAGTQYRIAVAAPSRRAAAAAFRAHGLNFSDYSFALYAGESGSPAEVEVTTAAPGRVFYCPEMLRPRVYTMAEQVDLNGGE